MSRPKGSKNKKTLEREKQALFAMDEKPIEKPVVSIPETNNVEADKVTIPADKPTVKTAINPRKIVCSCDKCHADIYCSPVLINLSHLLSQATWHRDCKLEKINLCTKCASELNIMIDMWLLEDNPDYYKWNTEKISENS